MKPVVRTLSAAPVATSAGEKKTSSQAVPTQAPRQTKRSPEPIEQPAAAWSLTTQKNGAVLAVAVDHVGFEGAPATGVNLQRVVTLAPPAEQTSGVKLVTMVGYKAAGRPQWKITPFTFENDEPRVAFGQDQDSASNVPHPEFLPVVAALRFQNEVVRGAADEPGAGGLQTYVMRAIDSVITLDGNRPVRTTWKDAASASSSSSVMDAVYTPALSQGQGGLSKAQIVGIGAGAAGGALLLVGVGAALLVRKSQQAKRAAKTEAFALNILPKMDAAGFNKV